MRRNIALAFLIAGCLAAADKYSGPVPPKPDIPYLLHASSLVETEVANAQQGKKTDQYTISGASSPARTPLAEPIFIIDARSDPARHLRAVPVGRQRRQSRSLVEQQSPARRQSLRCISPSSLWAAISIRVEVDEALENGEYALSPANDNRAYCFEIY